MDVGVKRAGAVSHYIPDNVLLCGGRSVTNSVLSDCLQYDLESEEWSTHSAMSEPREESTMAMLGSQIYIMGGVGQSSVEILDTSLEAAWFIGAELPQVMARACAVSTGSSILITGGHTNSSEESMATVLQLTRESGEWVPIGSMNTPRRDHACLYLELETSSGVLVTGGLGENDEVLSSAEFYDLATGEWIRVSSMQMGRTEHTMSLIHGVPTIIGSNSDMSE